MSASALDHGMAGYADCLRGLVESLGLDGVNVLGLSFGGALAIELSRRHPDIPKTLILVSAYVGWPGSLPADVADQRLAQAMVLADHAPDEFVAALLPTMFVEGAADDVVAEFGESIRAFHALGFRAMARAAAENLRGALPAIGVPTLLLNGADDVQAPLPVAEDLEASIAGSTLVVFPNAGHLCNVDAANDFNNAVRTFLRVTLA